MVFWLVMSRSYTDDHIMKNTDFLYQSLTDYTLIEIVFVLIVNFHRVFPCDAVWFWSWDVDWPIDIHLGWE